MAAFEELQELIAARLDEADRGDRGWFLTTRVHLSPARLQGAAQYLRDIGKGNIIELSRADYRALARVFGVESANPGVGIRRHQLLAMDTPLRFVDRVNGRLWNRIRLTPLGGELANTDDPQSVFEKALNEVRFCREPWFNASRVDEYDEFDVCPYPAVVEVMRRCDGYIDIDEFDLIVSRIRNAGETDAAVEHIRLFRQLNAEERQGLRDEVSRRMPRGAGADPQKPYNNWRDMARHTFSVFGLGTSAFRSGNELLLTERLIDEVPVAEADVDADAVQDVTTVPGAVEPRRPPQRTPTVLQLPTTEISEALRTPPSPSQANDGADAELLIGKMLTAAGWDVVYYNQRRGFGFDLWAQKGDRTYLIEVKSFVGDAGAVSLTRMELQAAERHGSNFLLVIVERCTREAPIIHVVQDPANRIAFVEANTVLHRATRAAWTAVALRGL